jgi:hypothetical protein
VAGLLGDSGAVACPDLWAVALRSAAPPPRRCPAPAGRRYRPQRSRSAAPARIAGPSSGRRAVSHRERSPSRARLRRVADAMAHAPPLTAIFPGKTSAPIRRTGEESDPGNQAGRSCVQAHMKRVCCVIGAAAISILILSSCSGQASPHQTVAGMLVRVGGPATLAAPPKPVPLRGEVVARNAMGRQFTAAIGKSGRFELSLPVGTYRLTGHSPQVSGETCSASQSVRVTTPRPLRNIWIVCSIS